MATSAQANLVICCLFICDFAHMRSKIGLNKGNYPLIYSHLWSFYIQIHYMQDFYLGSYLSHITRSACIYIINNDAFLSDVICVANSTHSWWEAILVFWNRRAFIFVGLECCSCCCCAVEKYVIEWKRSAVVFLLSSRFVQDWRTKNFVSFWSLLNSITYYYTYHILY